MEVAEGVAVVEADGGSEGEQLFLGFGAELDDVEGGAGGRHAGLRLGRLAGAIAVGGGARRAGTAAGRGLLGLRLGFCLEARLGFGDGVGESAFVFHNQSWRITRLYACDALCQSAMKRARPASVRGCWAIWMRVL